MSKLLHGWHNETGRVSIVILLTFIIGNVIAWCDESADPENYDLKELPLWARIGTNKLSGHQPAGAGAELTKGNMRAIVEHPEIEYIELNGVWIDEDGLALIAECGHINGLSLHGTNLSDKGVNILSSSKSIEDLSVCDSILSKRSLESIAKMMQLKRLSVYRSRFIRNADIRAFKKSRWDVAVDHDLFF